VTAPNNILFHPQMKPAMALVPWSVDSEVADECLCSRRSAMQRMNLGSTFACSLTARML
jgi:hypothetical protein